MVVCKIIFKYCFCGFATKIDKAYCTSNVNMILLNHTKKAKNKQCVVYEYCIYTVEILV